MSENFSNCNNQLLFGRNYSSRLLQEIKNIGENNNEERNVGIIYWRKAKTYWDSSATDCELLHVTNHGQYTAPSAWSVHISATAQTATMKVRDSEWKA
jgi:hypothetical protein